MRNFQHNVARSLRSHAWGIFFAVVVGLIAGLPSVIAPLALGSGYHGIQYQALDDEDIYRGRIHEILDGHYDVASPFLYEYKNDSPTAIPPIHEWLYALPALLFGLSAVVLASKFLLPAFLFFLAYLVTLRLLPEGGEKIKKSTAILSGVLVVFGADLVNYQVLIPVLKGTAPAAALLWTRLVNPITGGIEVFGFLYLLLRMRDEKIGLWVPLLAGIIVALSLGYFFAFGICGALGALFLAQALYEKNYLLVRRLVISIITFLVLAALYFVTHHSGLSGKDGTALMLRNGLSFTHAPVVNKILLATTIIFVALFAYAKWVSKTIIHRTAWLSAFLLLIASWIAFNQQVITGREIWYYHFVQYTVPLCCAALIVAVYLAFANRAEQTTHTVFCVLSALVVGYGIFTISGVSARLPEFAILQDAAPALAWLNANAAKDCVVLVDPAIESVERIIPGYTACNTYSTTATFSGVPKLRIYHNYFMRLRLKGVTANTIHSYLASHSDEIREYFFDDWSELFSTKNDAWLEGNTIALEMLYVPYLKTGLANDIRIYRADYYLSATPLSTSLRAQFPPIKSEITLGNYYLYSF